MRAASQDLRLSTTCLPACLHCKCFGVAGLDFKAVKCGACLPGTSEVR